MDLEDLKRFKGSETWRGARAAADKAAKDLQEHLMDPCDSQEAIMSQERIKGKIEGLRMDAIDLLIEQMEQDEKSRQVKET